VLAVWRAVRVVVDTNVWISALLNPAGPPSEVPAALNRERFTLVTSEPLLAEVAEVLARPRFVTKYGVTAPDISRLLALLRERAEVVPVTGTVHLCRDPDDDVVIETARTGAAQAMVSRDDDLKRDWDLIQLLAAEGIEVLSVRQFLARLAEEEVREQQST